MKSLKTYTIKPNNNSLYNIHTFTFFDKSKAQQMVNDIDIIKSNENNDWDHCIYGKNAMHLGHSIRKYGKPKMQHYKQVYLSFFGNELEFTDKIKKLLQIYYADDITNCELDTLFISKHTANDDNNFIGLHRDETIFSFIIQLNDPQNFEGGEIYYKSLNETIQLKQGEMIIFSGKLLHSLLPVIKGESIIISGFINILSPSLNPVRNIKNSNTIFNHLKNFYISKDPKQNNIAEQIDDFLYLDCLSKETATDKKFNTLTNQHNNYHDMYIKEQCISKNKQHIINFQLDKIHFKNNILKAKWKETNPSSYIFTHDNIISRTECNHLINLFNSNENLFDIHISKNLKFISIKDIKENNDDDDFEYLNLIQKKIQDKINNLINIYTEYRHTILLWSPAHIEKYYKNVSSVNWNTYLETMCSRYNDFISDYDRLENNRK